MRASGYAGLMLALLMATPGPAQDYAARVARVLKQMPLIDGHNDWAESLREREGEGRWSLDLRQGLANRPMPYNTDVARLRKGMVGGQFWSVFVSADLPGPVQVEQTLDQIDLVKDILRRYPETFALARTAADVRRIHASGRIASMIGVEGGGQIDNDLSVLRAYHALGAGYLTLSHVRTIEWVDSATDTPTHGGLTPFGEAVVHELNRLDMLVDLSHVSEGTMRDALHVSKAPVLFSHSSARALDDHPRNVSDDVLKLVASNGGVVMVNFAEIYISDAYRHWSAEQDAEKARLARHPMVAFISASPTRPRPCLPNGTRRTRRRL
jgi:membrane dipeptidase